MWIPPARPLQQRNTLYIGLDDQHIGFAEQRNGGDRLPTELWDPPKPPTAFYLASSVGHRTEVRDGLAYYT